MHQFLPLDVPKLVTKFLNHWSPNLAIFIDSEIWPNLILKIKEKKIPLLLINARITKKTFDRWKFFKKFSKNLFEKFDLCIVANNESENYLQVLGAKNIKNYGNLKFAKTTSNINDNPNSILLDKIKNRKIWCAASTHQTEEIFCAKTHLELKKRYKNILTIIIPRHVDRTKKIIQELSKLELKITCYSDFNEINDNTDILLIDAYGESSKFFNIVKCVFLGGSLIKHGGQNPIEASRLGCKIFHGANVTNFVETYEYLKSLNATKLIHTPNDLNQSLVEEFETNNQNKYELKEKINNYGLNILNNVIKDLKKYMDI